MDYYGLLEGVLIGKNDLGHWKLWVGAGMEGSPNVDSNIMKVSLPSVTILALILLRYDWLEL